MNDASYQGAPPLVDVPVRERLELRELSLNTMSSIFPGAGICSIQGHGKPHRADETAVWLRWWRNQFEKDSPTWTTIDRMLDDYRAAADSGVMLRHMMHRSEGGDE